MLLARLTLASHAVAGAHIPDFRVLRAKKALILAYQMYLYLVPMLLDFTDFSVSRGVENTFRSSISSISFIYSVRHISIL